MAGPVAFLPLALYEKKLIRLSVCWFPCIFLCYWHSIKHSKFSLYRSCVSPSPPFQYCLVKKKNSPYYNVTLFGGGEVRGTLK